MKGERTSAVMQYFFLGHWTFDIGHSFIDLSPLGHWILGIECRTFDLHDSSGSLSPLDTGRDLWYGFPMAEGERPAMA